MSTLKMAYNTQLQQCDSSCVEFSGDEYLIVVEMCVFQSRYNINSMKHYA